MKKTLILIVFNLLAVIGKCDTLNFCHVYLNDSLIERFNGQLDEWIVKLNNEKINQEDSLTIRYFTDTPCSPCIQRIEVFLEIKEKTPIAETDVFGGELTLSLKDLLQLKEKYGLDEFPIVYSERQEKSLEKESENHLLTVLIE